MLEDSHDQNELSEVEEERSQATVVLHQVRAELETLRQESDASWQSEKTAVELISEQRR